MEICCCCWTEEREGAGGDQKVPAAPPLSSFVAEDWFEESCWVEYCDCCCEEGIDWNIKSVIWESDIPSSSPLLRVYMFVNSFCRSWLLLLTETSAELRGEHDTLTPHSSCPDN